MAATLTTPFPLRILRRPEVEKRIGIGRSTIYLHMQQGTFPKPIRLGDGNAAAVGWLEHEIDAWLQAQIDKTRANNANPTN
jgi:prophage regulatory protein